MDRGRFGILLPVYSTSNIAGMENILTVAHFERLNSDYISRNTTARTNVMKRLYITYWRVTVGTSTKRSRDWLWVDRAALRLQISPRENPKILVKNALPLIRSGLSMTSSISIARCFTSMISGRRTFTISMKQALIPCWDRHEYRLHLAFDKLGRRRVCRMWLISTLWSIFINALGQLLQPVYVIPQSYKKRVTPRKSNSQKTNLPPADLSCNGVEYIASGPRGSLGLER